MHHRKSLNRAQSVPVSRANGPSETNAHVSQVLSAVNGPAVLERQNSLRSPQAPKRRYEVILFSMLVLAGLIYYWVYYGQLTDKAHSNPLSPLPSDISTSLSITYLRPDPTPDNLHLPTTLHQTALFNIFSKLLPLTTKYLLNDDELGSLLVGWVSGISHRFPANITSLLLLVLDNPLTSQPHASIFMHIIHQGIWRCESDECLSLHGRLEKLFEDQKNIKDLYSLPPPVLLRRRPTVSVLWELWGRFFSTGSLSILKRIIFVADIDVKNTDNLPSHLKNIHAPGDNDNKVKELEDLTPAEFLTFKAAHLSLLGYATTQVNSMSKQFVSNDSTYTHELIRETISKEAAEPNASQSLKALAKAISL